MIITSRSLRVESLNSGLKVPNPLGAYIMGFPEIVQQRRQELSTRQHKTTLTGFVLNRCEYPHCNFNKNRIIECNIILLLRG